MYGYKIMRGSVSKWLEYEDSTGEGSYVLDDGKLIAAWKDKINNTDGNDYKLIIGNGVNTIKDLLTYNGLL